MAEEKRERWQPLNPYSGDGEEVSDLTGEDLELEVAYFKKVADAAGEPYDPEWDRWLQEDRELRKARGED